MWHLCTHMHPQSQPCDRQPCNNNTTSAAGPPSPEDHSWVEAPQAEPEGPCSGGSSTPHHVRKAISAGLWPAAVPATPVVANTFITAAAAAAAAVFVTPATPCLCNKRIHTALLLGAVAPDWIVQPHHWLHVCIHCSTMWHTNQLATHAAAAAWITRTSSALHGSCTPALVCVPGQPHLHRQPVVPHMVHTSHRLHHLGSTGLSSTTAQACTSCCSCSACCCWGPCCCCWWC
jgi:hypothetical protein